MPIHYYCHLPSLDFGYEVAGLTWSALLTDTLTIWHVKASISVDCYLETKDLNLRSFLTSGLCLSRGPSVVKERFFRNLATSGYPNTM